MKRYCFSIAAASCFNLLGCAKTPRTSIISLNNECPPPTYVSFPKIDVISPEDPNAVIGFDESNWKKMLDTIDTISSDKKLTNVWSERAQKLKK